MGEKIATRAQTLSALLRDFVIREGKLLGLVDVIVFDRFRARLEASEERERERERAGTVPGGSARRHG